MCTRNEESQKKRLSTIWKRTQKKFHKNGNHITQPYAIRSWINCAAVSLSLSLLVCVCVLFDAVAIYLYDFFFSFVAMERARHNFA